MVYMVRVYEYHGDVMISLMDSWTAAAYIRVLLIVYSKRGTRVSTSMIQAVSVKWLRVEF